MLGIGLGLGFGKQSTAAAVWSPAALPGLVAWFDAGQASGVDGANLATWPDASGAGFNLNVQVGTTVFHATGGPNGKPCVSFASGPLQRAAPLVAGADAARTFFIVYRVGTDGHVAFFDGRHGSNGFAYGTSLSVSLKREVLVGGVAYDDDTTSNRVLATWEKAGIINTGTASQRLRVGGAEHTLSAGNAVLSSTQHFSLGGNDQVFQADSFIGDIAEFIGCTGVLSAADIAKVESYLNTKYGV